MSGSAGGNRITRMSVENTVQDYIQKVLSKFSGFKKAKATGSYNAGTKQDFGDIDLIVQIEGTDKKLIKQDLAKYFSTLPDSLIVPFKSDKYKGKKSLSSGELVTILYPIAGISDQYVQIDNIISVSEEESTFKNTFLDYSAEVQGLLLGLAKVTCLEEDPQEIFKRLGIKNIPTLELNQEYEFNLSGVGLTLRVVTLDNFKEVDRTDVWKSSNWNTVKRLFDNYNIDSDFKTLLKDLSSKLKNERSKNRIKGIFKSMVSIKSGEVGTPKGDNKQVALDAVDSILENMLFKGLVKELIMPLLEDESQETIAIYPGKFKPPHKGHFEVAKQLIGKADKIIIAISGKEVEGISAEQSKAVWELYNTLLGGKLDIIITNKSPVKYVLDTIEANPNNHYIAVHGKEDKDRYRNVGKDPRYINAEIFDGGAISSGNKIINATDLRVALANNKNISKFLPKDITPDQYEKALGMDEVVNESFYKHSIQHTIQEDINTWGTLPEYKIDLNNIYDYEKKGDFYSFYDDVNDCDIIVKLKNLPSGLVEFKFYPVKDNNILGFIKLKQINPKVMNTVYKIFQDEVLTKYNSILIQPAGYTRYRLFRAMLNNNICLLYTSDAADD
jgi:cytidyltransferase-like protein